MRLPMTINRLMIVICIPTIHAMDTYPDTYTLDTLSPRTGNTNYNFLHPHSDDLSDITDFAKPIQSNNSPKNDNQLRSFAGDDFVESEWELSDECYWRGDMPDETTGLYEDPFDEERPLIMRPHETAAAARAIEKSGKQDRAKFANLKQNRLQTKNRRKQRPFTLPKKYSAKANNNPALWCETCDVRTPSPHNLAIHNQTKKHMRLRGQDQILWNEQPYQCAPCKYGNPKKENLRRHESSDKHKEKVLNSDTHSTEEPIPWNQQPHQCEPCQRGTPFSNNLKRHNRSEAHKKEMRRQEMLKQRAGSNIPSKNEETEVPQ